ncbi:amidase domain-containing protein [Paludicola sp. MB14-C6]|uniref:amidase domain-containing protein n=1 Tax=Paludihabitans sp. MB14-C6 TaxID=3070656 RepID=UPI0027DACAF7|nr:amidase domain-containing protein [Paludicola sp. MB14-C6]WMJ23277.1 amidase domain-containing protein [Paludicola sp. MB14-C6]
MEQFVSILYNREKAVNYANTWAYLRNPNYYDFSKIGGDCTNYASQCVFAGCDVMNYKAIYGWYYMNSNNRAPAWTSVKFFYRFMTTNKAEGPYGYECDISEVVPGDLVQIRFQGSYEFDHTPIITDIKGNRNIDNIYVAAHSIDCNNRTLSSYENVGEFRYIHIEGARNSKYK